MGNLLNKILYRIPLVTQKFKDEISEIIQEEGIVTEKKHEDARTELETFCGMMDLPEYYPERDWITFKTNSEIEIIVDNKNIFNRFNERDKVNLDYREHYTAGYDYQPPNFDEKVFIDKFKTHRSYEVVSVEKI